MMTTLCFINCMTYIDNAFFPLHFFFFWLYALFSLPTLGFVLCPSVKSRAMVTSQIGIVKNKATKTGIRTGLHLSCVQI